MRAKSKLTSPLGDVREKLTIPQLLERLSLAIPGVNMLEVIRGADLDENDTEMILREIARDLPRRPHGEIVETARGLIQWGIAIGYFYAKKEKPLIVQ